MILNCSHHVPINLSPSFQVQFPNMQQKHRNLTGDLADSVSLFILLTFLFNLVSSEFCGHSLSYAPDRLKRSSLSSSYQASQQNVEEFRAPPNLQEDQTLIDDASLGQFNDGSGSGTKSARIECAKTSLKNGSGSSYLGRIDGIDCNTKTIETAVFLDQALDNKFSGLSGGLLELNKLVLTIMNQVQHLFSYNSMQVPIKIKLVLVEHLGDIEKHGGAVPNAVMGDIDAYLSNFCNWQSKRLEREKRSRWDHAILLSG